MSAAEKDGLILSADIGGTKTFFGLFKRKDDTLETVGEGSFINGDYKGPEELIGEFLGKYGGVVESAAFGIAGPVIDNRSELTNLPWVFDAALLKKRFAFKRLELLNDLVAMAWGVDLLAKEDLFTLQAGVIKPGNSALVSAGTGLGEAILFWDGSTHIPSGSEGGHADFAPRNALEIELLEYLIGLYGHASYERVLSGQGLENIYKFLKQKRGGAEPGYLAKRFASEEAAPVISDEAINGKDKNCRDALDMFVSIYGAEAGNLALRSMAAAGVYIGGGIAPKVLKALKGDTFIESFREKGRMEKLLSEIPVHVILNVKTGLFGAARYAASEGGRKNWITKVTAGKQELRKIS